MKNRRDSLYRFTDNYSSIVIAAWRQRHAQRTFLIRDRAALWIDLVASLGRD